MAHGPMNGPVTLPTKERDGPAALEISSSRDCSRRVLIAAARKVRCVEAEVRWRWTLKVLKTAA